MKQYFKNYIMAELFYSYYFFHSNMNIVKIFSQKSMGDFFHSISGLSRIINHSLYGSEYFLFESIFLIFFFNYVLTDLKMICFQVKSWQQIITTRLLTIVLKNRILLFILDASSFSLWIIKMDVRLGKMSIFHFINVKNITI